jgi:ankyrin repeat domain-containing protein 17
LKLLTLIYYIVLSNLSDDKIFDFFVSEHRDKKGFTPLILAATAGHEKVVEILLDNNAEIEAQSERTKDTPLSLACSGGRYEVVESLLRRNANKEHRNVSDYTPLSLAASGGYVNIIKLLLAHGAEINSRTGSKLGISPLMLAAMNGHTCKLFYMSFIILAIQYYIGKKS